MQLLPARKENHIGSAPFGVDRAEAILIEVPVSAYVHEPSSSNGSASNAGLTIKGQTTDPGHSAHLLYIDS